ncbi:hypothetical protein PACILC2_04990 [Paenibacillus cisolokensis]|uniref:Transmembrane protein n=1 Tax=Paenibacillus cisolokensis TaxID=1658519 RepID=A0ABQ4N171_9BACL|nr:hypothetical protein [Paenibacillus cisolokensis]GIQ61931.1 hypothetical protein PACILC2_04990 [Paenibacillus cisolokensis]
MDTNLVLDELRVRRFSDCFLFSHRAVTEARHAGEGESRLHKLKVRRRIFGMVAAVAFVVMTASFLINMRLNG